MPFWTLINPFRVSRTLLIVGIFENLLHCAQAAPGIRFFKLTERFLYITQNQVNKFSRLLAQILWRQNRKPFLQEQERRPARWPCEKEHLNERPEAIMNRSQTYKIAGVSALAVLIGSIAATAMIMRDEPANAAARQESIHWNEASSQAQPDPQPACNDDNIVGKVTGGLAGGLIGSQIGSGSGKTAATIGGAVGGTIVGEEYIPTKNVTCR
jgi:hypothetical protein